jgi:pyruvate,water dikinase
VIDKCLSCCSSSSQLIPLFAYPRTFSSPGEATIERTSVDTNNVPKTKTKIQLILGDPDAALSMSGLPVDGVGLVRQEFVVANHIGIHPMAVLHPEKVSPEDRDIINERSKNDKSPKDFFLRKLSEGIGSIAASFYPRPVLVRLGDFKSNEYRRLVGGERFEPEEENPMIGLRGASRYLSPEFSDGECRFCYNFVGLFCVTCLMPQLIIACS